MRVNEGTEQHLCISDVCKNLLVGLQSEIISNIELRGYSYKISKCIWIRKVYSQQTVTTV